MSIPGVFVILQRVIVHWDLLLSLVLVGAFSMVPELSFKLIDSGSLVQAATTLIALVLAAYAFFLTGFFEHIAAAAIRAGLFSKTKRAFLAPVVSSGILITLTLTERPEAINPKAFFLLYAIFSSIALLQWLISLSEEWLKQEANEPQKRS